MAIFKTNLRQIGDDRHIPRGEIKFYNALKFLSDEWIVWFSQEWIKVSDESIEYSEADFLLFNQKFGFIVIEVKGGDISIDRNGNWYTKKGKIRIKDPFKQARKSMFFFRDLYIDNSNLISEQKKIDIRTYLRKDKYFPGIYTFAVVFPDCDFKEYLRYNHAHVNSQLIFDSNDLKNLGNEQKNISNSLENWLEDIFYLQNNNYEATPLNEIQSQLFIDSIGKEISTKIKLVDWLDYKEKKLELINQEQDRIIRFMQHIKNAAILGSAGTGKTFIALKKILSILTKNPEKPKKILFLCYNVALKGFVMENFREMLKKDENLIIHQKSVVSFQNIDGYISLITKKYLKQEFPEKYNQYLDAISDNNTSEIVRIMEFTIENIEIQEYNYDAIIIDETQDFPLSYFDFIPKFKKETGIYWIFYDDSQKLWKLSTGYDNLQVYGFSQDVRRYCLTSNLRNLRHIVDWFKCTSNYGDYFEILSDSNEKVEIKKVSDFEAAIEETFNLLQDLKEKSIDFNKITILTEGRSLTKFTSQAYPVKKIDIKIKNKNYVITFHEIEKFGIKISEPEKKFFKKYNLLKQYSKKYGSVNLSTISSFKGLENNIVILLLQSKSKIPEQHLKQVYVGASRAKLLLYVIEFN